MGRRVRDTHTHTHTQYNNNNDDDDDVDGTERKYQKSIHTEFILNRQHKRGII